VYDLDHYLHARDDFIRDSALFEQNPAAFGGTAPIHRRVDEWHVASVGLSAGYVDECTTFSVSYIRTPNDAVTGTKEPVQSVLLRLELRTLGEANFRQNLTATSNDGIVPR
jgi:LPS-assembly protein